mgnify:CR=1 FL=1
MAVGIEFLGPRLVEDRVDGLQEVAGTVSGDRVDQVLLFPAGQTFFAMEGAVAAP